MALDFTKTQEIAGFSKLSLFTMPETVKYIRQDAPGRRRAVDNSSLFRINAPKYIYASFIPIRTVPNERTASSNVAQRADTSDQVSDRTLYASDSNMSAESLSLYDFSELRRSHERNYSRFSASSGSVRASNHDMEGNPSVGYAFLSLLKAIGRLPGKLLLRESRSIVEGELTISPGFRRRHRERRELTPAEEREAAQRARDHWICVSPFEKGVVFNDFANKTSTNARQTA